VGLKTCEDSVRDLCDPAFAGGNLREEGYDDDDEYFSDHEDVRFYMSELEYLAEQEMDRELGEMLSKQMFDEMALLTLQQRKPTRNSLASCAFDGGEWPYSEAEVDGEDPSADRWGDVDDDDKDASCFSSIPGPRPPRTAPSGEILSKCQHVKGLETMTRKRSHATTADPTSSSTCTTRPSSSSAPAASIGALIGEIVENYHAGRL